MLRALAFASVLGAGSTALAQQPLEVPGHAPASFVPAAGTGRRPVIVALHGNFDRPEWMCGAWAPIVRGRAFLLCPRGLPRDDAPGQDRWQLPAVDRLAEEVEAARRALSERHPGRVDDGPDVWIGFSQGANRISEMAARAPERFARIQLVEGGTALWHTPPARRYAATEGRVALVCAVSWCEQRGRELARTLRSGRAQVMLQRRPTVHHDLRTMEPAIRRTFEWLIEGDPRFAR